ncbi:MAG TPA: hypothetical protein VJ825_00930 [Gemmatimonadaceae bacterium]|nr:hypothetical protein [Gemmatimonadaceae bacterium]
MTLRSIKSMMSGASPVFTMCPPSITTTARFVLAAPAMAATTARKSRATRTSGRDSRNAAKLRSLPGGDANSEAATLLGRRSIGTVRTLDRSASAGGEARDAAGALAFFAAPFFPRGFRPWLPLTRSAMAGRT